MLRERHRAHFGPEIDLRPNKFAWMGSTKPLDAFTFLFEETQWGPFIAHAYQYEPGASTWVFETDPETFRRAGLDRMDEAQSARLMEEIFGWFLQGHKVKTNRSLWRNFPMIRNARWVRGNLVLLGDAKSSAHFSIGSGTKLAMEDAIALYEALHAERSIDAALARFETARREEVEKTQHAADVSLVWFEHVDRFWDFDPVQFAFGVMTRAKAITYDNLRLRAPAFVDEVDRHFARQVAARGFDVDVDKPAVPMFQPLRACATWCCRTGSWCRRWTCTRRSTACRSDWHLVHYGARAIGGAALMFTEMTCPSPRGPHHARLHRPLERRAGAGLGEDRRFRARELGREVLPAARSLRPQGRDEADVGGHGPAARRGRLGRVLGLAVPYFPDSAGAARNGPRRHGPHRRRVRRRDRARRARRLRHARAALRPRLSASRASSRR